IYPSPEKIGTCHLATVPHQSILCCGASDDAAARGPWFPVAPTCDTGNRAAESALHRWPRGPVLHCPLALVVFFMRLLPFGIGLGNRRTWFAQSKTQPPEQTLAFSQPQGDPVLPLDPGRQRLAVPYIPTQAYLSWHPAKSSIDPSHMLFAQASRPPGSVALTQCR